MADGVESSSMAAIEKQSKLTRPGKLNRRSALISWMYHHNLAKNCAKKGNKLAVKESPLTSIRSRSFKMQFTPRMGQDFMKIRGQRPKFRRVDKSAILFFRILI